MSFTFRAPSATFSPTLSLAATTPSATSRTAASNFSSACFAPSATFSPTALPASDIFCAATDTFSPAVSLASFTVDVTLSFAAFASATALSFTVSASFNFSATTSRARASSSAASFFVSSTKSFTSSETSSAACFALLKNPERKPPVFSFAFLASFAALSFAAAAPSTTVSISDDIFCFAISVSSFISLATLSFVAFAPSATLRAADSAFASASFAPSTTFSEIALPVSVTFFAPSAAFSLTLSFASFAPATTASFASLAVAATVSLASFALAAVLSFAVFTLSAASCKQVSTFSATALPVSDTFSPTASFVSLTTVLILSFSSFASETTFSLAASTSFSLPSTVSPTCFFVSSRTSFASSEASSAACFAPLNNPDRKPPVFSLAFLASLAALSFEASTPSITASIPEDIFFFASSTSSISLDFFASISALSGTSTVRLARFLESSRNFSVASRIVLSGLVTGSCGGVLFSRDLLRDALVNLGLRNLLKIPLLSSLSACSAESEIASGIAVSFSVTGFESSRCKLSATFFVSSRKVAVNCRTSSSPLSKDVSLDELFSLDELLFLLFSFGLLNMLKNPPLLSLSSFSASFLLSITCLSGDSDFASGFKSVYLSTLRSFCSLCFLTSDFPFISL